jgi:hypothetical protein
MVDDGRNGAGRRTVSDRDRLEALAREAPDTGTTDRVIVEMRPSRARAAAGSRARIRPLFDTPASGPASFGVTDEPRLFLADLPESAATPWDLAHERVAAQLGVAREDVLFVEPDLIHRVYLEDDSVRDASEEERRGLTRDCTNRPQNPEGGQAVGSEPGWHLGSDFTQLAEARAAVEFTDRRTRIAHLDTGYDRQHGARPERVLEHLERSFVEDDTDPGSARDPDGKAFPVDNTGHGTGTLGILAGRQVPSLGGTYLGGCPHADIVPLRIADSVVLLKTSAFARALDYATSIGCDVVSMSMGGLPSRTWRRTVDRAYEAGVCIVSAAGNNFNGLPTRKLVYPARYGRVIGVSGVMADGRPYAGIDGWRMEGNYGPTRRMQAAMAAYTPNIPWPRYGCGDAVRMNGGGTSSATPQVAAAAALWIERYKGILPASWSRVEAVRNALFRSALKGDEKRFGQGILRARDALEVTPALELEKTPSDSDSFALFRVLTGLGLAEPSPRERMFNVELAQRWLLNPDLHRTVPDPDEIVRLNRLGSKRAVRSTLRRVMEAIIEDSGASLALRRHMADRYRVVTGSPPPAGSATTPVVVEPPVACDATPEPPPPSHRRLRVYATDPSLSTRLSTAGVNDATLRVKWEPLNRGPVGEYVAVRDWDASGTHHRGVDLDDPRLLARDGWAPSEGNAQFHQQMVYAVAMKTIEHFERATGRPVLWRSRTREDGGSDDESGFVRRLTIHPHARHEANAFYSPEKVSLEFGYFEATPTDRGELVPGSRVYTCLSHDIIAHETTHALLDGMHRRFSEPTNPDVLAFHEAFADLVALLQHFTMEEWLESEIARARGDLDSESRLGSLAVQFGRATGRGGALREAVGRVEDGVWRRRVPDPGALTRLRSPHGRGAILVAAVFDAYLAIYRARTADLLRLYTGGTGVLSEGAVHPDLVGRLAREAATSARHVLTICIRALDYLPPVDITFFEYLRALITADHDLVPDDPLGYRVAFVEAFRRHGIYPADLGRGGADQPRTLSVQTLRWKGLGSDDLPEGTWEAVEREYGQVGEALRTYADECTYLSSREELFRVTERRRHELGAMLEEAFEATPDFARHLGLAPDRAFEVHALRRAQRSSPDGRVHPQIVLSLTQSRTVEADPEQGVPEHTVSGGSTVIIDLSPSPRVRYRVVKNVDSSRRTARTAAFLGEVATDPLWRLTLGMDGGERFAALHGLAEAP